MSPGWLFFLFEWKREMQVRTSVHGQAELRCAAPTLAARLSLPTILPACTPARAPCLSLPRDGVKGQKSVERVLWFLWAQKSSHVMV